MATNHDLKVVEKVKGGLYCVICQILIKDDMQLGCDHGLCKSCLDDLKKISEKSGFGFVCPRCRFEIFQTQGQPSIMIDWMLSSVTAKYKNTAKGCEWTGELCKMMDHYSTCDKYPVKCPYNCSDEFIEREKVEEHCNTCGKEIIQCEFVSYGCDFTCPRENMSVHNQDASRHLSLTVKKYHVDMQEMKEEIDKLHSQAVIRENSEIDFYQEKVSELVKQKENSNSVNFKKLFEPSIIKYQIHFGYFVKGVPWLITKLEEVCEGKDHTCKAVYEAILKEYIKMLKGSITDLKKEVHLPNNVWEKIENNIEKELPKQLAIKGKDFIKTSLSLKNRLHNFVERLKPNTMYQIEGNRFYKLYNTNYALARLFSITSQQGCSVFGDEFLDCSVTYYNFCLTLKTREKFCCVIYTDANSEEGHKIEIDGTQLSFETAKYYFSSYYRKYYIIVRFSNRTI
ncbi:TNF receptor-associated factor 5-like isoform X2 [Hydractinia symbiolongicarpus]|uniref:TNF receptor-associated factor 5-like isoform X2 n=1 Tax=Hydractinia symbiolongicarpus TaxID=13093 RepID=UPI00255129BC|nr:TNF receptor-associated factor 5-like isoform X2 [Hydractinia symbiolongicarpus]